MRYQTSRQMRRVATEIGENIASMQHSYCEIAERCGLDDPRLDRIDADIAAARQERANLIARANGFDYAA